MADEGTTLPPVVDVVKPALMKAPEPPAPKDRRPMVIVPVSGEPRLRLINVGTVDEAWQCNEIDFAAARVAADAGLEGLSMKGGVVMFDGIEVTGHAGS